MSNDAISTVGGLWSAQILDALRDEPSRLSDTNPADYRLPARYPLRDATRQSWGLLSAAWADFHRLHQARVEADGERYGDDRFTVERWLSHLWAQLGYQDAQPCGVGLVVDDGDEHDPADRYPIDLLWHDRVPIIQVPAGVPLDRLTAPVHGGVRRSPHAAMQDYLNRTSRHLWGIVTNGLTLRLLRNNSALTRQAYVEFNLAEIFTDGNYPSFAALWLALHATRFDGPKPSDCPAERWQHHALDTGVRALNTLRQGVEHAIITLGQALIAHPRNQALRDALRDGDLDGQGMYRELLYVAYRHVFLFAVEDRGLLHADDADRDAVARYRDNYSTVRLRQQARRHTGGQHPDGWAAFQTLTRMLANPDGQPLLALPPLLGHLWDPASTPHLNDTTVPNRAYYEAIRSLAYVRQDGLTHRIDYRNLGAEELGSVYESLLELIIDVSPSDRTFTKRVAAGSDRKTTGSYYTPTSLIIRVLDDALDPVIDRAVKGRTGDDAANAILDLTVCDPAMGSGHFLVAAAHRLAKHVATHRTDSLEPDPAAYRQALRDVTSRCIYGVDINPMAVELAKISLWLECHVPGQPLTFLDHHLKCGNALLGVGFDPDLIAWTPPERIRDDRGRVVEAVEESGGIPDAAFKPVTGDDKALARSLKASNKNSRAGEGGMLGDADLHEFPLAQLAGETRGIAWMDDTTPEGLAAKERAWMLYGTTDELQRERLRADAWTACWTIPKTHEHIDQIDRPHDVYYDSHYNGMPADTRPGVIATRREAERHRFFHWYLEFPEIADTGGFSCAVGNPPWEQIRLLEREWFTAAGRPDIAEVPAKGRKKLIDRLRQSDDSLDVALGQRWFAALHDAKATEVFARDSGRFPFGGVGRVNTYALFADHFAHSTGTSGRSGIVVPTGVVTDYTYREFFAHLVTERRLVSVYDFENRRKLFPEVHSQFRFVALTVAGVGQAEQARFAFMVHDAAELDDPERSYLLTAEQIELVNPNTKTAPVFLTSRDKDLTCRVYAQEHITPLITESPASNPWSVHLTSVYLETADREHLWSREFGGSVPVADAKTFHQFDDRWATYDRTHGLRPVEQEEKSSPDFSIATRLFSRGDELHSRMSKWQDASLPLLAWRDVTNATNERTAIAALIPNPAVDSARVAFPNGGYPDSLTLLACWNSYAFDYIARQKLSGSHLAFNPMKQMPVPKPGFVSQPTPWCSEGSLKDWVVARSAALSVSTWNTARALGFDKPVIWNATQRELWRTELDAAMFHLYGYSRDEVSYVMDTFPIVARKDRQVEGLADDDPDWRTKRLILAKYDELAEHAVAGTTYVSPDPPPPLPGKLRLG